MVIMNRNTGEAKQTQTNLAKDFALRDPCKIEKFLQTLFNNLLVV